MSNALQLQTMYRGFSLAAQEMGFARSAPERKTLRDRTTITVASDVGSASQPFKAQFFAAAGASSNICVRSDDPKILDGSGISKDTVIGIFGVALRMNHGNYAGTLTETREVLDALGDAVLEISIGSEKLVTLSGWECLVGSPGFENSTDTATATATARTSIDRRAEPFYLEWARMCTDQAMLKAELSINKTAYTANDNYNVFLELLVWIARQGSPAAASARVIFPVGA